MRNPSPRIPRAIALVALLASGLALAAEATPSVISEGGVGAFWRQTTPELVLPYPATAPDPAEDVCVSVGYLIKPDGSTSEFSMVNSWTSKHKALPPGAKYAVFAQSAVAAVMQRHYAPAQASGVAPSSVYTASTFAFSAKPDADQAALRSRCSVADLPGMVAKAQKGGRKDGSLRRAEMERARMQSPDTVSGPGSSLVH